MTRLPAAIALAAALLFGADRLGAQARQDAPRVTPPEPTNPRPDQTRPAGAKGDDAKKPRADYGKYEFSFTTLEGRTVRLSDYAGKVVLVNIWAPWCGPCKFEMPGFVKLHEKYAEKGFEILSVAVQTNESAVREFLEQYPAYWPVGIKDEVAVNYGTYGLPDNYLFLPDGSMEKRFIGYTREEALEPLIKAGLKQAAPKSE